MPKRKLTPKQDLALREYLKDLSWKGASDRSGLSYDYVRQLVTKPHIKAILNERIQQRADRVQVTADMILEEYWKVWTAKTSDIVREREDGEWEWKPLSEWPEIWERMTTPSELRRLKKRSRDGKDDSWDDIGQSIKVNIMAKAEALHRAGEHVNVKAFPQRESTININITADEITDRLHAGRAKVEGDRVH